MNKQDKFFEGYKPDFLSAIGDKRVRDWNKDMELIEQYEHAKTLVHGWIPQAHGQVPKEPVEEALKYWLLFAKEEQEKRMEQEMINDDLKKELAAEKERADRLEERNMVLLGANQMFQVEFAQGLGREKKLREAIERIAEDTEDEITQNYAKNVLASLYPKEEEAKNFTFDAIIHIYDGIKTTVQKQRLTVEAESAEEAEKKLSKKIHDGYKVLRHLGLSSLLLTLVEEEEAK